mgnify:CR=1 FL=1
MTQSRDFEYVMKAHTDGAKKEASATRMWDQRTPYHFHPIWCATTILHETSLPESIRIDGSQALLYHDIVEDTIAPLPDWLSDRVRRLVNEMTFHSSEDEWENLWNRDKEVRLLKVYDKTSNLLDGVWMNPQRRAQHVAHLRKLVADVRGNYGDLNILKIAETQY